MTEQDLISLIEEVLEERKKKRKKSKKKKKSSGKKDACYYKVKSRYKTWPSAYASGALVKCRKVGAKNWGNSTNEELTLDEEELFEILSEEEEDEFYDEEKIHNAIKEFFNSKGIEVSIKSSSLIGSFALPPKEREEHDLEKYGGVRSDDERDVDIEVLVNNLTPEQIELWHFSDEADELEKEFGYDVQLKNVALEEKKRKLTKKPSSETSLRDWFKRKGEPGKGGGWVDCNSPIRKDGKITGYKSCGRSGKDDKRSKYPACRPTPSACKSKGRGKSWGKKSAKGMKETMDNLQEQILTEVMQLLESTNISEGMQYHLDNKIPITETIYRPLSESFMRLMKEARTLYSLGLYEGLTEDEREILESDLGKVGVYEEQKVLLDFPMVEEEELDEAKYKGKDVKLNKPQRGGSKKFYVYVRDPKSGNIRKVSFGDPNLSVKIKDPERRKSFVARHKCKEKKDKTTAGFWACRVGRYPHLFGGKTKYTWW